MTATGNPLAEDYLRWLAPQIDGGQQDETYWDLYSIMFEKVFEWFVPNDDNRCSDGVELRAEFCYANHIRPNALKDLGPCSFLEVLLGLSRRLAFAAGGTAQGWAWQLVINLELDRMPDPLSRRKVRQIDHILETVIERTYQPDGYGGFFPLTRPDDDQTQKELWYQMAAYINELHPAEY
jgi:hypothetical protein